ncbi:hypothetical protein G5C65_20400 [Streptomyces sp. SB3404]|uniref:Putative Flp pilus-assembly TadG-like N-terminal domain-containing protein n=2 Tax=Streptomyces boncukensis TaxID=2711219 RepID=A0A6G4X1Y2_9ACTN|nr:hypothetical protein [Streptomyces boncukensis]
MMAILLFAAFAFFAVAQASTVRNGGQSAADAAALAAAQEDRDELLEGFLEALGDGEAWRDWLDGIPARTGDGCGAAERFAGRNRSDVLSCDRITRGGDSGYTVRVRTRFDTGRTLVPGTDNKKAEATATAVVQPRCRAEQDSDIIELTCDGDDVTIDPDDEDLALEPADLFDVVLAD